MVAQHFRWDFYGLSTDTKPTAENPKVADGSTYYEADTSKLYVWYKDQWYEKASTGGGGGGGASTGAIELTEADYNYPESNPNSVALWLLPIGNYYVDNGAELKVKTKLYADDQNTYVHTAYYIVSQAPQRSGMKTITVIGDPLSANTDGYWTLRTYITYENSGASAGKFSFTPVEF